MKRASGWTRRDLLKGAALAVPALAGVPRLASAMESPRPAGGALQVIVVGAGLAGLSAAYELVALGHGVTVLEAQPVAGGRVRTLRQPFADGLYAEAGAIDFSASFRHLMRYVQAFNLPTVKADGHPLATVYHLRGRRIAVQWGPKVKDPDWPFALTPEERALGVNGMFQKYFAVLEKIGDPTLPGWRLDPFASYDRMTVAEFLHGQGVSREAVELLGDVLPFGYGWSQVSVLHRLLTDMALFYLGPEQKARVIAGGNDLLPRAFANALGDRIQHGVPVVKVLQQAGGVRAVYRLGGEERSLAADRLICSVPCPALRNIAFTPELAPGRRRMVDELEYNPVTRIYLQVKRRFWTDAGNDGLARTDLPIQVVNEDPQVKAAGQARGILECHLKGPEAARVAGMDQAAQLAFAVDNLEKVHPGFRSYFETGTAVAWGADPWAGGGYAWWKPGQLTGWMPELAKPEGRVHFAGEHTSLLGRTMEGALESGNRAAREVHAAPRGGSAA